MFTVFANMLINSVDRFEHLKDSFESFDQESDDWLINIRGSQRQDVIAFLKERLGNKATFFELTDDSRGWSRNALDMLKHAKHDYVFIWLEDHMNMTPKGYLKEVAQEMSEHKADFLMYSWWRNGKNRAEFDALKQQKGKKIDTVFIDESVWSKFLETGKKTYLVSLLGIFNKNFFERLLEKDTRMFPLSFTHLTFKILTVLQRVGLKFDQKDWFLRINTFFGFRFRKFANHEAPHDIEKDWYRFDILPMRIALPKEELFVCMDDDDNTEDRYSLMTLGTYPIRDRLIAWDPDTNLEKYSATKESLVKGTSIREAYTYFKWKGVRHVLSREYIRVLSGRVLVTVYDKKMELGPGEGAAVFCNIPHEIQAVEDAEIERLKPDLGLAPYNILK